MNRKNVLRALLVPVLALTIGAPAAFAAEGSTESARKAVNLNQATAAELQRLPRVGPTLAERILEHRKEHGAFKRVEDLMEVKGVGEKMFALLKPYLAVTGATTLTEKVASASRRPASSTPAKERRPAAEKPVANP